MNSLPDTAASLRTLVDGTVRRGVAVLLRGLRALPMVVSAPAALVPVALGAAIVVSALAAASTPIEKPLALPEREAPPTWTQEVGVFAGRLESAFGIDGERARSFAAWILEASARQQLPPELIAGLIYTESSFRLRARSWAGAVGPAQVKPRFWRDFCGGSDLAEPEHNVYCGAQILAHYMQQCGEFDCALRLYNVGPGNMRKPHFQRAGNRYLAKVEGHRSRLEGSAGL